MQNNIYIDTKTRNIKSREHNFLGIAGEHKIEQIVFKLSAFISGEAILEIQKYNKENKQEKYFINLERQEESYIFNVKNSLLDVAKPIKMQLHITTANEEVFKSKTFEMQIYEAIDATETIPEEYAEWIDIANSAIAQMHKLEQTISAKEEERQKAETNRTNSEKIRNESEKDRLQKEKERQEAEQERIEKEKTRIKNESDRIINENGRIEAEKNRKSAEENRTKNETQRAENEETRKTAETKRAENTANAIAEIKNLNEDYKKLAEEKTEEFNNNSTEKINAFNSNAEEKIADYNEHVETLTSRIADLEEETDDLFNALDTEKASGTELYIEDAKPCRVMNTEFGGMYKQKTTEGYNLFNLNTILSKHYISVTGTVETSNNYSNTSDYIEVKANKTYLISYNYNTLSSTAKRRIATYNSDKTCLTTIEYELSQKSVTITPSEDGYIRFSYDINCTDVQVVEGTENKTYESYTGGNSSPNPDYPQEIKQVESVKLEICNQNLFDGEFRQGSFNSLNNLNRYFSKNNIYIETGDYLVITDLDFSVYNYGIIVSDNKFPTTVQNFSYDSGWKKEGKFVFSITKSGNLGINLRKNDNSNITLNMINDIKFVIFKLNPTNIDLKGNKLCAVSDKIKDKLLIDRNGNVALQKNVIKIDISNLNNNSWRLELNNTRLGVYSLNLNVKGNENQICNYFSNYNKYAVSQNSFAVAPDFVRIRNDKKFTTVEDFKNWLQKNNLYAYCEIKNTQLIDLGQIAELPKTFEGINNIWAETNLGNTEIEVEYVQDVKKLLEQQNARLDSIEALLSTTETSALLLDNMQTDLEKEVE